jgi:hypothetical protein
MLEAGLLLISLQCSCDGNCASCVRCAILANGGRTAEVRAKALTITPASGASFLEASTKSYPASFLWVKTLPICGSARGVIGVLTFLKVLLWESGVMRPFNRWWQSFVAFGKLE